MKKLPNEDYLQSHLEVGPKYKGLWQRRDAGPNDLAFNLDAAAKPTAATSHHVQYGMAINRKDFDQKHLFLAMPASAKEVRCPRRGSPSFFRRQRRRLFAISCHILELFPYPPHPFSFS